MHEHCSAVYRGLTRYLVSVSHKWESNSALLLSPTKFSLLCNIVKSRFHSYCGVGRNALRVSKLSFCKRILLLKKPALFAGIGWRKEVLLRRLVYSASILNANPYCFTYHGPKRCQSFVNHIQIGSLAT